MPRKSYTQTNSGPPPEQRRQMSLQPAKEKSTIPLAGPATTRTEELLIRRINNTSRQIDTSLKAPNGGIFYKVLRINRTRCLAIVGLVRIYCRLNQIRTDVILKLLPYGQNGFTPDFDFLGGHLVVLCAIFFNNALFVTLVELGCQGVSMLSRLIHGLSQRFTDVLVQAIPPVRISNDHVVNHTVVSLGNGF